MTKDLFIDAYGVRRRVMIGGSVLILGLFIGFLFYRSKIEEENWQHFVKTHNCVVVGKTNRTIDSAGRLTPGQTGWKCDDGITYWR